MLAVNEAQREPEPAGQATVSALVIMLLRLVFCSSPRGSSLAKGHPLLLGTGLATYRCRFGKRPGPRRYVVLDPLAFLRHADETRGRHIVREASAFLLLAKLD